MWNSSPSANAAAAQSPSLSLLSLLCCCFHLALNCNRTESKLSLSLACASVESVAPQSSCSRLRPTGWRWLRSCVRVGLLHSDCFDSVALEQATQTVHFSCALRSLCLRNNKNKIKQVARASCELSEKFWNICAKLWNTQNIKTQTYDECINWQTQTENAIDEVCKDKPTTNNKKQFETLWD